MRQHRPGNYFTNVGQRGSTELGPHNAQAGWRGLILQGGNVYATLITATVKIANSTIAIRIRFFMIYLLSRELHP